MDWIKNRTHIIDHPKFLDAGALGRDLWQWGMNHAGKHETDGELSREAVLTAPWGAGTRKGNEKLAEHLVTCGLWEATATGWRALRWKEQGNLTKAEIEENRAAARKRVNDAREEKRRRSLAEPKARLGVGVRANIERTTLDVPTSLSHSDSGLISEGVPGEAPPKVSEVTEKSDIGPEPVTLDTAIPPSWRDRAVAIARGACMQHDPDGAWRRYVAWCVEFGHKPNEARWSRWVEENVGETAVGNARRDDTNWGRLRVMAGGRTNLPDDAAPFHAPTVLAETPDYDRATAVSAAAALAAGNFGPGPKRAAGGGT